jgi:hypothetical protein
MADPVQVLRQIFLCVAHTLKPPFVFFGFVFFSAVFFWLSFAKPVDARSYGRRLRRAFPRLEKLHEINKREILFRSPAFVAPRQNIHDFFQPFLVLIHKNPSPLRVYFQKLGAILLVICIFAQTKKRAVSARCQDKGDYAKHVMNFAYKYTVSEPKNQIRIGHFLKFFAFHFKFL